MSTNPINSVRTRVIRIKDTDYMPQVSTDGLSWFDIAVKPLAKPDAENLAQSLYAAAIRIPSRGSVVFNSN